MIAGEVVEVTTATTTGERRSGSVVESRPVHGSAPRNNSVGW